ncbi:MAG: T9SS type A sorting domain-containing protein [Flavobacteriales bacterium]
MKKTVFFLFFFITFFSQGQKQILPVSWSLDFQKKYPTRMSSIVLPPLDIEGISIQDSINDLDKTMPWRYGIERPIVLDFENTGTWTILNNGDKIWRISIKSPEALNVSVNFNQFYLPEGTTLHLYNEDHSDISKTYTKINNRPNDQLASWFVDGNTIIIEYFQASYVTQTPKIEIGSIIHGYRMGRVNRLIENTRGLNDSGACNYDVNCSIGNDFDNKKDILKKAVALLNLGNGYLCSASLINNTNSDKKPYLITANHCLQYSDPSFWVVRFNWTSPNPVCAEEEESQDINTNFTISGAVLRASNELSDFALVELVNPIPNSWDVSFAGWDKTDTEPSFEIGIHHPNGDVMKVCRDDSGAVHDNANGTEVWLIGGASVGTGNGWEIGTTESGSSGSPLFNQNGNIIGQLYAGQSACNGTENNQEYDIYGRFAVSWDAGNTPETRLKDWLDPTNTGQEIIESLENALGINEVEAEGQLEIFPNPVSSKLTIINGRYPNLVYQFYNLVGQKIKEGNLFSTHNEVDVQGLSRGVYFLHLIDHDSQSDFTQKIIVE